MAFAHLNHKVFKTQFIFKLFIAFFCKEFDYCLCFYQGFGRKKNDNRAGLCLRYIVFSFESDFLRCSILVIKMVVRF